MVKLKAEDLINTYFGIMKIEHVIQTGERGNGYDILARNQGHLNILIIVPPHLCGKFDESGIKKGSTAFFACEVKSVDDVEAYVAKDFTRLRRKNAVFYLKDEEITGGKVDIISVC